VHVNHNQISHVGTEVNSDLLKELRWKYRNVIPLILSLENVEDYIVCKLVIF